MLKAFQLSEGTETTDCTGRVLNCMLKAQPHGEAQEWLWSGISGTCCSNLLCIVVCTRLGCLTAASCFLSGSPAAPSFMILQSLACLGKLHVADNKICGMLCLVLDGGGKRGVCVVLLLKDVSPMAPCAGSSPTL